MSIEAISYGASQIDHFFIFGILQNGESDLVEELVLRVGQTIQPMTMRCEHSGKPLQPGFRSCLCRPAARLSANTGNNATIGAPTAANTARLARVGKLPKSCSKRVGSSIPHLLFFSTVRHYR